MSADAFDDLLGAIAEVTASRESEARRRDFVAQHQALYGGGAFPEGAQLIVSTQGNAPRGGYASIDISDVNALWERASAFDADATDSDAVQVSVNPMRQGIGVGVHDAACRAAKRAAEAEGRRWRCDSHYRKGGKRDVVALNAIFFDLDTKDGSHAEQALPNPSREQAEQMLADIPWGAPTWANNSGGGIHCWYRMTTPVVGDDDGLDLILKRVNAWCVAYATEHGFHWDSGPTLSLGLHTRFAGLRNRKYENHTVRPAEGLFDATRRVNLDEMLSHCPAIERRERSEYVVELGATGVASRPGDRLAMTPGAVEMLLVALGAEDEGGGRWYLEEPCSPATGETMLVSNRAPNIRVVEGEDGVDRAFTHSGTICGVWGVEPGAPLNAFDLLQIWTGGDRALAARIVNRHDADLDAVLSAIDGLDAEQIAETYPAKAPKATDDLYGTWDDAAVAAEVPEWDPFDGRWDAADDAAVAAEVQALREWDGLYCDPERVTAAAAERKRRDRAEAAARPTTWERQDLSAVIAGLQAGTLTRPTPTVGVFGDTALFYPGTVNGLAGESGSGKSWTALLVCVEQMLAGHNVVYIDYEDSPLSIVTRLLDMGVQGDVINERFTYLHPEMRWDIKVSQQVMAMLDALNPTVVIIDSIGEALALQGANPNADEEVARFYSGVMARIAGHQCEPAVVGLDHVPKPTKAQGDVLFAIGSQRKRAAISGSLIMQFQKEAFSQEKPGFAELTCAKDRHGNHEQKTVIAKLHIGPKPGGGTSVRLRAIDREAASNFRFTHYMEQISRLLEDAVEPLSSSAIFRDVKGREEHLAKALDSLVEDGHVKRTVAGRGKFHESVKPYRKPEGEEWGHDAGPVF